MNLLPRNPTLSVCRHAISICCEYSPDNTDTTNKSLLGHWGGSTRGKERYLPCLQSRVGPDDSMSILCLCVCDKFCASDWWKVVDVAKSEMNKNAIRGIMGPFFLFS